MEIIWCTHLKPCGFYLKTTWYVNGNHMVSSWKPCGVHVVTTLSLHRNHMVFMYKQCPHGQHVVYTYSTPWLACGHHRFICRHHMVSMWTSCGFHVDTMWFPHGHHVVSMWMQCGYYMGTAWFPDGHHVVSMSTPCGFQVEIGSRLDLLLEYPL